MSTTETKLNMSFAMDNGKTRTIQLKDAYVSLTAADVQPVMASMVTNQAFLSGTAVPESIKAATVVTTTENVLIGD